jgi:hypothetical protein
MRHCLALCTARAPLATIFTPMHIRSYWIPGSYAPALSEKCNSFLRLLKNKGFKEERMTKVGLHAIGKSTTLESNKSLSGKQRAGRAGRVTKHSGWQAV